MRKTLVLITLFLSMIITPSSYAQENSDVVEADWVRYCSGIMQNNFGITVSDDNCLNTPDEFKYRYTPLYNDMMIQAPAKEDIRSGRGFYYDEEPDGTIINGEYGRSYKAAEGYGKKKEDDLIDNSSAVVITVSKINNKRIENNSDDPNRENIVIPLSKNSTQLIPAIGDPLDKANTILTIEEKEFNDNIDKTSYSARSIKTIYPPEEGIAFAVGADSIFNDANEMNDMYEDIAYYKDRSSNVSNDDRVEREVVTVTKEAPEPLPQPDQGTQPTNNVSAGTFFNYLLLLVGFILFLVFLVFLLVKGFEFGGKKRELRKQQEELHRRNLTRWNNAGERINKVLGEYSQAESDPINSVMEYPMIKDVTHPLHHAFITQWGRAMNIMDEEYSEFLLEDKEDIADKITYSWNEFFSTAKEVGLPWVRPSEKETAVKMFRLMLNDAATEHERELARERLVKYLDKIVEDYEKREKENKPIFGKKKETIFDKYNVKPRNLKKQIDDYLAKPISEITKSKRKEITQ